MISTQSKAKKPLSEQETRKRLLGWAKKIGFEGELVKIFERTDRLLAGCTNEQEKQEIQVYGALEIHKLFGGQGPLAVGNVQVIEDKPDPNIPIIKFKKE